MNIYLLEQDEETGYDTYDSCVVIAESENAARNINPSQFATHVKDGKWMGTYTKGGEYENESDSWVKYSQIDQIKVTLLGVALEGKEAGVVCASFNAR